MKTIILFSILILFPNNLIGQNLIENGDFEIINTEPSFKWKTLAGTPDYLKLDTGFNIQNKYLKKNELKNNEKNGYMGIVVAGAASEVFYQKLSKKLKKDKVYKLSCHILAGISCKSGLENATISFSPTKLESSTSPTNYNTNFLRLTTKDNFIKHGEWIELKTIFKAKGNEQFISIGNFHSENSKYIVSAKKSIEIGLDKSCHYLIFDNFFLEKIELPESAIPLKTEKELNRKMVIDDVFFESGKSELKPQYQNKLDSIFRIIEEEVAKSITIIGYTDNVGKIEDNKKLSMSRAENVKIYFVNRGYKSAHIITKGLHENNPIMSNDTEYGRSKNRRVEIIIEN